MQHVEEKAVDQGVSRWEKLRFSGQGGEYFRIWIVNIFLSILTLGIYSAWAKVRTNRYFYGNTILDGASFEYHAKPLTILKGRVIAVAILVVVTVLGGISPAAQVVAFILLGLLTPLVVWRSMIFNARMSSYRNVRFDFVGKAGKLYQYMLLLPLAPLILGALILGYQYFAGGLDLAELAADDNPAQAGAIAQTATSVIGLTILVVYLMIPWIQKLVTAYYLNNHRYGQGKFRARLGAGKYYLIYLAAFAISIGVYFAVAILIAGVVLLFSDGLEQLPQQMQGGLPGPMTAILGVAVFLPLIMFGIWIKAYVTSRVRNYALSRLRLDSAITVRSRIRANRLFWIQFTNLLLLVLTLGIAWPWAIVRLTRYKTETLYAHLHGSLDDYVTQMQHRQSALGEEMGEAFDLDLDLGL